MANPQLEAFLSQVMGDAALGAERGFTVTGVVRVKHQAVATLRLSDSDLEAAAAGVELEGHLWLMQIVWG